MIGYKLTDREIDLFDSFDCRPPRDNNPIEISEHLKKLLEEKRRESENQDLDSKASS